MLLNGNKHHVWKRVKMEHGNEVSKPIRHNKMAYYINHIDYSSMEELRHKVHLRKDHKCGQATSRGKN